MEIQDNAWVLVFSTRNKMETSVYENELAAYKGAAHGILDEISYCPPDDDNLSQIMFDLLQKRRYKSAVSLFNVMYGKDNLNEAKFEVYQTRVYDPPEVPWEDVKKEMFD